MWDEDGVDCQCRSAERLGKSLATEDLQLLVVGLTATEMTRTDACMIEQRQEGAARPSTIGVRGW